jgi:histidyl-tRNA synthetase
VAIIAGGSEWSESRCLVKTLATKETADVPYTHDDPQSLIKFVEAIVTAGP